ADAAKASLLEQRIAATERQIEGELKRTQNREAFESWIREVRPEENFLPLQEQKVTSTKGQYRVEKDGRVRLEGEAPTETTITVKGTPAMGQCQALVLATLPDNSLPERGPGAASSGNFILTHIRAALVQVEGEPEQQLEFTNARATFEQHNWPVTEALRTGRDEKVESEGGWAISGGIGKPQTATFFLARPLELPAGAKLVVTLECENEKWPKHVLGSFRLATSRGVTSEKFAALPKDLRDFLEKETTAWTPEERSKAERHFFFERNAELSALYRALDKDKAALAALPVCNLLIMKELTGKEARTTRVFHRGNWL